MATTSKTQNPKSGGLHIAYQVTGSGPLDLIVVPGFVSHLEYPTRSRCPCPRSATSRSASTCRATCRRASASPAATHARRTTPPGDFTAAVAMPGGKSTDVWYFIDAVDVLASPDTGGIVALGDSLTDANISTIDAFCRWPDQLSRRLQARAGGRPMGVLHQGLGGNPIPHAVRGHTGLP